MDKHVHEWEWHTARTQLHREWEWQSARAQCMYVEMGMENQLGFKYICAKKQGQTVRRSEFIVK